MAIDLSGLQEYVQDPSILIGKVMNKESVLKLFVPHTGAFVGQAVVRIYDAGGDLGACCETPDGSGEFTQALIPVECFLAGGEWCNEDFFKYFRDAQMRLTAGGENGGNVAQFIVDQELAKVAKNIDRLVFQGDTASSDPNLNRIDGLIKQIGGDTTVTGNIYTAIQQMLLGLNPDAYDLGTVGVFVGVEVAAALQSALIALNLYNFNPGNRGIDDPINFPGFANVQIIPTRGLSGTNKVVVTPLNNIHWLTNLEDDQMTAQFDYNAYHQRYYWRIKFLLGVGVGVDEYAKVYTLDPSVLTSGFGLPVSIVSPLNAANTAVSTQEVA